MHVQDDTPRYIYVRYILRNIHVNHILHFHSATRSLKITLQNIRGLKGNLGFWIHCWYIEVMELFYTYYINSQKDTKKNASTSYKSYFTIAEEAAKLTQNAQSFSILAPNPHPSLNQRNNQFGSF